MSVWLSESEAVAFVGRAPRTLRSWRKRGWLKCGRLRGRIVYDRESLKAARSIALKRMMENQFQNTSTRHCQALPQDQLELFVLG